MIFNIYFNIDEKLVNIKDIQDVQTLKPQEDWYYFSGSIELINNSGEILLDKNNPVDIIPFFREFFATVAQYKLMIMEQKEITWDKFCTRTSLYYPNTPTMIFYHQNDVYMNLSIYHQSVENNIKPVSINEEIDEFYKDFKDISYLFLEKTKLLFPNEDIEFCTLVESSLSKF